MTQSSKSTSSYFPTSDNLDAYIRDAQKFPMLESEEEYLLAKKWVEEKDPEARKKLVESHLKFVVKIASGYRGYGLPLADLISEGNVGLLQALNKFDPEMGNRFSTYAQWWIKAAIQDYVLKSWSMVKIGTTSAQKKLFFSLKKIKHQLQINDDVSLLDEDAEKIAQELQVPVEEVKSMQQRLMGHDSSLNKKMGQTEEASEWQDWLKDDDSSHEDKLIQKDDQLKKHHIVREALHILSPREKEVLVARKLEDPPKKLDDLASVYNISKERVRQIEVKALYKLHQFLEDYFTKNESLRYLVK